ncbi:M48 family metalloprotease [Hymenobacter sp. BT186]|uniref:M48 family metalloprotease n=1 Tax=Hymenobacter telluris TaxID=2816474 RepID=A0A939ESM8_9BACT|nr:M48 family metalloprotease [Hymenobacter telluris]MBO0356596.1 M48 family metalloprotease [Hymenobacter telluris]MBW3372621.1 M48 family metalloprotease [Hymenobacter norwichensis]
MRRPFLKLLLPLAAVAVLTTAAVTKPNQGFILFSVQQDIDLGAQVARQTDSLYRAKGQLLARSSNARAYQLLDGVVKRVLDNGNLKYRTQFPWDVQIIKDDATQNAFATPGGHIYVFSGLIKFLDNENQLAGVLGHEIAHADRRHSSQLMQKQYGIGLLTSIVLGNNPNQLVQLASGIGQLKFSRTYEVEADKYSTIYLNGTRYYACDGAAGFFIKAEKQGGGGTPEFLSTHPNPGSRVTNIQKSAQQLGCTGRTVSNKNFEELKRIL